MFCFLRFLYTSVESGTWEDDDGSELADDGETVSYAAVVKNEGTVTLATLSVVDVRAGMICEAPDSGLLGQGEEYVCRGSSQVGNQPKGQPSSPALHFQTSLFSIFPHVVPSERKSPNLCFQPAPLALQMRGGPYLTILGLALRCFFRVLWTIWGSRSSWKSRSSWGSRSG